MVGHTRNRGVHLAAAQLLRRDDFARGGLHQRRSAEVNRALVAHDDGLVAHGRHVGTAGGAHAHHDGDLRDAHRRHARLVVEEPPKVVAIGEDGILLGQEGTAAVDHIDARQMVFHRNLLSTKVFLHRVLHIGTAFHRGVVGHNDCFSALNHANARDDARRGEIIIIGAVGRHRREFEERCVRVDEQVDALAGEQLVAFLVFGHGRLAAALHRGRHTFAVLRHQREKILLVLLELFRVGAYVGFQYLHGDFILE